MKYTLLFITIFGIASVIGAYTWAHITGNKNKVNKYAKSIQSAMFYGLVIGLIGVTYYYYIS